MIKISLIIPVYNVEPYIIECLESVANILPKINLVEVIIVNDGSPDQSIYLIKEYISNLDSSLKSFFVVISQENKGLSSARNTGIKAARGQYLAFLDSDDVLKGNFFNDMLKIIETHSPDIIQYRGFRFDDRGNISKFLPIIFEEGLYSLEKNIWRKISNSSAWFTCLRLYKKILFNDIKFPEGKNYEDVYTTPYIYLISKNIYFSNYEYLGYRFNLKGITATKSIKNIEDIRGAAEKMLSFINTRPELSSSFISLSQYYVSHSYEVEGFKLARERWVILKNKSKYSGFSMSYIENRGNKFFYIFGVYFIAIVFFLKKIGIKK